jgi:hypothetical protein
VQQGPDGLLYVLTDGDDGALMSSSRGSQPGAWGRTPGRLSPPTHSGDV